MLSPLRQVISDEPIHQLPPAGQWGPYEAEEDTRLEPLPVALRELHEAGLVRSGDPEHLLRNTALAHLVMACDSTGLRRGAFNDRILEYLARGEDHVIQVVIGLIRRAHAAGTSAPTSSSTRTGSMRR